MMLKVNHHIGCDEYTKNVNIPKCSIVFLNDLKTITYGGTSTFKYIDIIYNNRSVTRLEICNDKNLIVTDNKIIKQIDKLIECIGNGCKMMMFDYPVTNITHFRQ